MKLSKLSTLSAKKGSLFIGYLSACLGGFPGLIIGYRLRFLNRGVDSAGNRIYAYDETSRKHGLAIFLLGIGSIFLWILSCIL